MDQGQQSGDILATIERFVGSTRVTPTCSIGS